MVVQKTTLNLECRFICQQNDFLCLNHFHEDGSYHAKNLFHFSSFMRKPAFHICENKCADQLYGHFAADQRLCFRYIDSTIPPLYKSEISNL